MMRIAIIGTTATGKSYLARRLGHILHIPVHHLDELLRSPDGGRLEDLEFRKVIERTVTGDAWVIDGGYKAAQDIIWPRADLILWLDFPLSLVLFRQVVRALRRKKVKKTQPLSVASMPSAAGAVTVKKQESRLFRFFGLMAKTVRKHRKNRREYPMAFEMLGISGERIRRFYHPAELESFLRNVSPGLLS